MGHSFAAPRDDLASPSQEVRDVAASELRKSFQEIPESTWQPTMDAIHAGQTKAQITDLIRPYHVKEGGGAGGGGSHSESYQLDDGWMLICWFQNKGDVLIEKKLIKSIASVWGAPPKDFTGRWITYFVSGEKSHEIIYREGKYDGEFISYHDNGQKAVVQHYVGDVAMGEDAGYHPSGRVSYRGEYRDGKQVGRWVWYDDEGNMASAREGFGVYQYNVTYFPSTSKPPHGILFCNGSSLPVAFEHVITPIGEFVGTKDDGAGDWKLVEKGPRVIERKPSIISSAVFINGSLEHPPEEIGDDWFYVVKKGMWVNPKKWYNVPL